MATRRLGILEAILTRLSTIRTANGFDSDAGAHVHLGEEPSLGPDDAIGIAVVVGDEDTKWIVPGKACEVRLPIGIQVLAAVDLDAPWLAVESAIGDVKRAMEVDANLGGLTDWPIERGPIQTLAREPGSVTVGAVLVYQVQFKESWGAP